MAGEVPNNSPSDPIYQALVSPADASLTAATARLESLRAEQNQPDPNLSTAERYALRDRVQAATEAVSQAQFQQQQANKAYMFQKTGAVSSSGANTENGNYQSVKDSAKQPGSLPNPATGTADWWSQQIAAREAAARGNTVSTPASSSMPGYREYVAPPRVPVQPQLTPSPIERESYLATVEQVRQTSGLSRDVIEQYYPVKYGAGTGAGKNMALPGPMGMMVTSLNPTRVLDRGVSPAQPQESATVQPDYGYRSDPLAVTLEGAVFLGDSLTFGLWTPGSELLTAKGQNVNGQKYGAFSDWSAGVGAGIQRALGQKPATLDQFNAYEQTTEFKNAGPVMQFGEGAYKVIATDPASLAASALQGVEFYAGMGAAGALFESIAPAVTGSRPVAGLLGFTGATVPEMAAPTGIAQQVGYVGVKALSSPGVQLAVGVGFVGYGVGSATEWGTLPQQQSISNLGGMSTHLVAMVWGGMAPESFAKGIAGEGSVINPIQAVGKINPVSINPGVPLRAAIEGEFNYVSTIGVRNPFTNDIPSVKAYAMTGVNVEGVRVGLGSPIPAMRDIPIKADPMFNVRAPSFTMTEPQRVLLDPFFRSVSVGTPESPLVNAMFDMKANIGANIRGGSENILKYKNAQPAGTLKQTGIDPAVQFEVHEVLADSGAIRLGSAAQTDWLGTRFMRDTSGSDIDIDIPKANYQNAINLLKNVYSKNVEPVRMPTAGGKFSLMKNPESETIISPGTTEKFQDVRSLIEHTISGKEIGQQTPEYGIESKASRSLGGRILEYDPNTGITARIHGEKFDKDIGDIFAASKGIARTAYEQNQFKMGQTYESIAKNLEIYADSKGMGGVIKTIPEDILGTPEAIAAKAKSGILTGSYRPDIFGVGIPEVRFVGEYPEAYPEFKTTPFKSAFDIAKFAFYGYPVSQREIVTKYPTAVGSPALSSRVATLDYPASILTPARNPPVIITTDYPAISPPWIPDYPTATPPWYPPSNPPPTTNPPPASPPTNYPPSNPPPTTNPPFYPPWLGPPIVILPPTNTTPPKKRKQPKTSFIFREILPIVTPIEELGGFKNGRSFFRAIGNQQIMEVKPQTRDYLHYVDVDQDVRELQQKETQNKVSNMAGINFYRTATKQEKAKTGKPIVSYTPTQQEINMAKMVGFGSGKKPGKGRKNPWF